MKRQVPTGVKIISVVYYIAAAVLIISGILFLVGASLFSAVAGAIEVTGLLSILGSALFTVVGISCIIISVLAFFVARGLWNAKSWARILVIVFSCLGILAGFASLIQGSFASLGQLAVSGIIGGYLLFNKEAKRTFS